MRFERTANAGDVHMTRSGGRIQTRFGRDLNFVADRNVAPQFGVLNVADANDIAILFDRRVRFQIPNFALRFVGILAPVIRGANRGAYVHGAGIAVADINVARASRHLEFNGSGHFQGAIKRACAEKGARGEVHRHAQAECG